MNHSQTDHAPEEPTRPCSAAPGPARRRFLYALTGLLSAVAGVLVTLPVVGFVFKRRERVPVWVDLGPLDDFPLDETRLVTFDNPLRLPWDGMTAETGVFVRFEGEGDDAAAKFRVMTVNCAHLGCPVTWFPQSSLFLCPCHGGVYYSTGERASGPPPRGLFHCVWRVRAGRLEIQAPHYPTLHNTLEETA